MVSSGIRLLLIGNDFGCLRKRARALHRAGIQAIVSDPNELETHVGNERFDLVVLCHTLSDLQRRTASDSARRRWPSIKVMQVFCQTHDFASFGCALDAAIQDEPGQIIERAMALMGIGIAG
jgi:hypothetical protein